jgi:hypothetical protein
MLLSLSTLFQKDAVIYVWLDTCVTRQMCDLWTIEIVVNLERCAVLEAMWRIENKKSAVLKPKQNSKNIWQNLKNNFLIQFF